MNIINVGADTAHRKNKDARHAEVARRYAWHARQKRKDGQHAPADPVRLITLIRLREIERLAQSRWGRFLPDDDAGRDDFKIVAHHIAHLGGDVREHVSSWAAAWCPWMAADEAAAVAAKVIAKPVKWTADTLGWRLGLTDAERTALKITTIGAIDVSKAERLERRKAKHREAERARRAKRRTGKPRGRPKLNACTAGDLSIAVHAFMPPEGSHPLPPPYGLQEAATADNSPVAPHPASTATVPARYTRRTPAPAHPHKVAAGAQIVVPTSTIPSGKLPQIEAAVRGIVPADLPGMARRMSPNTPSTSTGAGAGHGPARRVARSVKRPTAMREWQREVQRIVGDQRGLKAYEALSMHMRELHSSKPQPGSARTATMALMPKEDALHRAAQMAKHHAMRCTEPTHAHAQASAHCEAA